MEEVKKTDPRNALGFVRERCRRCNTQLYLSDERFERGEEPICLNGCALSGSEYRRLVNPEWVPPAANVDNNRKDFFE